jgi:hypothetical protein
MDTTVNQSTAEADSEAVQYEAAQEAAPAPEPAAEAAPFALAPEGHIVVATRALEAAKSSIEQALMGLHLAPQETGMICDVLDAIQAAGAQASRSYLDYAFARDMLSASVDEQHQGPAHEEPESLADEPLADTVDSASDDAADTARQAGGTDEASDQASGHGAMHYIPGVHEALLTAEQVSHQAGRQVLTASYEHHRLQGIGTLETLAANAQLAAATLKWDSENLTALIAIMGQMDRLAAMAKSAIEARMQLAEFDAHTETVRVARSTPTV